MLFIIALTLGVIIGIIMPYNLTSDTMPYVAVAIIAAMDSIFGGIVANFQKRFSNYVFIAGLVTNAILAVALTYVGNIVGINLSFAAIVVFGGRIFNNLSNIRREVLDKYFIKKENTAHAGSYIGIEGGFETDETDVEAEEAGAEESKVEEEKAEEEKAEEPKDEKTEAKKAETEEEKNEKKTDEHKESSGDENLPENSEDNDKLRASDDGKK